MNPPDSVRKTQRKPVELNSDTKSYSFIEDGPSTMEDTQEYQNTRAEHIHQMLNKMTTVHVENEGSPLENFTYEPMTEKIQFSPSTGEEYSEKNSFSDSTVSDKIGNMTRTYMKNKEPMYISPYSGDSNPFSSSSLGNTVSSYKDSYSNKMNYEIPSSTTEGLDSLGVNKIKEKMNYIIYLLEQQQHEETHHVMEEFILYTLLGVFVIYIIDSFSRTGKYIR